MLLDEGVLQPHSLAKYAAAFFQDVSLFSHTLEFGAKLTQLGLLVIVLLTLFLGFAVELDPGVEAVNGHAQALGNIGDRFAFLGHLLDRFDLELFGVTLATHGTSYLGLIMRLGGVYETRGDSDLNATQLYEHLDKRNAFERVIEKIKAQVRAKVELIFRVIKCLFGYVKTRLRSLAENTGQLTKKFALSNLWMMRRQSLTHIRKVRS